jgi:hypothetical protein
MAGRIYETHDPEQFAFSTTIGTFWLRAVAHGSRALRAFVKRRIGISHFDRDAPPELFTVGTRPHTGDCFNKSCLAMVNVA